MTEAERLYEYHERVAICEDNGVSRERAEEIAKEQGEKHGTIGI
jgi:hypothetical protein